MRRAILKEDKGIMACMEAYQATQDLEGLKEGVREGVLEEEGGGGGGSEVAVDEEGKENFVHQFMRRKPVCVEG